MISRIDENKNVLIVENSRFGINMYIRLEKEKHRRYIATIDELNRMMFVERESQKHTMNINNSYGFNHFILANGKKFDKIAIIEYPDITQEFNIYLIPVATILEKGDFLHFKKQGFEKQIFITKNILNEYKVDAENKISFMKQYRKVK